MKNMRHLWTVVFIIGILALPGIYLTAYLLPPPKFHFTATPSNLILDRKGRLLYEWTDPQGAQMRPVSLTDIAPTCIQATIATEDARFYTHWGVDPVAIFRSIYHHIMHGTPFTGASTLTQQFVRIAILSPEERYERILRRKIKEAWLAFRLERHFSKNEILELYLNHAYYGHFAVGIEAAAHAYFNTSARNLDLAQCALLAGLPQAPAVWDPTIHPLQAQHRQRVVLRRMLTEGMISHQEYMRALAEPLAFAATPFPIQAPHFVMMVQNQLETWFGEDAIRAGGWVITTTLDLDLQQHAEHIVNAHLYRLNHDPHAPPERRVTSAGVIVLDVPTGEIITLVGSPNYFDKTNAGAVNTTLALRQPGSAIKPIVYAAVFAPNLPKPWAPPTLVLDELTQFVDAQKPRYVPQNYDLKWHGVVSVREALAASYNVPAVKALEYVGLKRFLAFCRDLGLSSLAEHPHPGLSLALGAGEVSLFDLTNAYATFARGGTYLSPRLILKVSRHQEGGSLNPVPIPSQTHIAKPVLDPRVAYLVTHILSDRYARIPTFGLNTPLELDRPAAVKTGTTTDWRDAWTLGYTPQRVTGVWVGNWDGTPMVHLSGLTGAAPIWHAVMNVAHKGIAVRPFPRPPGVQRVRVCWRQMAEKAHCSEDIIITGTTYLRAEPLISSLITVSATSEPPSQTHHLSPSPSPEIPKGEQRALHFLQSPEDGATYRLDPDIPAEEQMLPLQVHVPEGSSAFFFLDGQMVGMKRRAPYRLWWPLVKGHHTLRVDVRLPGGLTVTETAEFTVLP